MLLLCEQNILQRPLLYISHYFKKYRAQYYARLQAIRDSGDWEGWLKFFLRGVYEVAQETAATVRKIANLKEEHHQLILNTMGSRADNAITLLENLYFRPIFTVEHAEAITNLSSSNATSLIKDLSDLGLLQEITRQKRNRAFSYAPYLAVFQDS